MKFLLIAFSVILGGILRAQQPASAIQITDLNVLYRGYKNKLKIAVTNNNGREIIVTSQNAQITSIEGSDEVIAEPGNGKTAVIVVSLKDSLNNLEEVSRTTFRVTNMPNPVLYWGGAREGFKGSIHSRLILAKYPPEIPLMSNFTVLHWSLSVDSMSASGSGSNLLPADSIFRSIRKPTIVTFDVQVIGSDGIKRTIQGTWEIDAWTEPKKVIRTTGCG